MRFPGIVIVMFSFCLVSCSSVSEKIPTVKVERKKPKIMKQVSYNAPEVQKAEAAMVCENANMRAKAADKNMNNDTARVLILEESKRYSNVLADVEINCRDYFNSLRQTHAEPEVIKAVYSQPDSGFATTVPTPRTKAPAPKPLAAEGYFYTVRKGDTLYQIARENCSTIKSIASLNGIADPTMIDRGQVLRLPASKCNARN